MDTTTVRSLLERVSEERLRADLFHLARDPLPFRKLNYTRPGAAKSSLYEADDTLQAALESCGYSVVKEGVPVQAFRCDATKPKAHQYAAPDPEDPWYTAYNLSARRRGRTRPDETVVVLAHKDSQSWVDSPGAYDNAAGTCAVLEIARLLVDAPLERSLWILFCNEEHQPWTSEAAAQGARERGEDLVSVWNIDAVGGKPQEDIDAGRKTNVTLYTEPEGERLADLMAEVNERYAIGLEQRAARRKSPGDDDGSFVKAGYPAAVANLGSWPYGDPNYHLETDVPEAVDLVNVRMVTQASLAALLHELNPTT